MRVLVACEWSGVVRDAFRRKGHDAWSCDIKESPDMTYHLQCDVKSVINGDWDLVIAHPPCTYLCSSGARWWRSRRDERYEAAKFFLDMYYCKAPRVCVENPVGYMSTVFRKPDQYIQPWQFGHGETKRTGLWLSNLPLLIPTNIVSGRVARIHKLPPTAERSSIRSITYSGIAEAMADQWGSPPLE